MEIDQDIDQGVVVGDRRLVAQFGPLDAQSFGLTEDAFGGCALPVKPFVILTLTVELVTDTGEEPKVTTQPPLDRLAWSMGQG